MAKESVLSSPLPSLAIFDGDVASLLWPSLSKYEDRIAVINSETKEECTYGELRQKAECLAAHLLTLCVQHGDVVTLYSSNCVEYVVMMLAVWRIGATCAFLNAMAIHSDVHRELQTLQSSVLFTHSSCAGNAIRGAIGSSIKTILVAGAPPPPPGCVSFSHVTSVPPVPRPSLPTLGASVFASEVAALHFSSGTTGLPKAVMITHHNYCSQVANITSPSHRFVRPPGVVIFQPLAHIYGGTLLSAALAEGATSVLMPRFSLDEYVGLVEEHQVHTLVLVPPVTVQLAKSHLVDRRRRRLSCVRHVQTGAAPLSHTMEQELNEQFGGHVLFKQGYGLTETTGLIVGTPNPEYAQYCQPEDDGSIGILIPDCQAKVKDVETGKSLGPHQRGELLFRGPSIMKGYLGNPSATAGALDAGGWLHSGDIGYYDNNGCFYVVDRLKEIIKYNAFQVAPSELEAVLLTHPAVADTAVAGRPDPAAGELPAAWVVLRPGHAGQVSEADIDRWVADRVAAYKKLRGGVTFVESIPKSPSGKILRKDIRKAMMQKSKL